MQRPKPKIITNVASIIVGKFLGAMMAVKEAASQKQTEQEEINNRSARRHRARRNWSFRKNFGQASRPGTRVLRGYYERYTHVLSEYVTEQNKQRMARGRKAAIL